MVYVLGFGFVTGWLLYFEEPRWRWGCGNWRFKNWREAIKDKSLSLRACSVWVSIRNEFG